MTELDKSLSAKKSDLGQPVLELRDTSVVFKTRTGSLFSPNKVQANKGISFQIYRNDIVGIVGESGCGKSTLAKVMVGLQKPTSGEVLFKGEQLGWGRSARKQMGKSVSVVFQDPATSLNPRMSVQQQLLDPLNVHGVGSHSDRLSRVRELLSLVGLPQSALNVLPRQISGGQRQRVAIARALVLEPDVIIADEPTSALDVSVRAQVLNLLLDLKREMGLGLVFISHDINTVRYVSDRICVMLGGEIVEENTTEEIFGNPQHEYTRELLSAVPSLLGE
ncbi:ABC transporter ATP-binding protein [Corynebacterium pseudodiphtheriticum]|uniref:ABC transporter ATP-binding protein n=1 Tax=Corynebacterium pseudodiphtheriticum TaxID=37637 RepID=UPI00254A302E|nr:ATP-binding cassette domain-containing protein [Corynebacterium pseudodiphtheriticum]MDK8684793.1 ATP-binding cassette domain-containing protein [Corynebacterium pseudodiphtheriticum]